MTLLIIFLLIAIGVSFFCSIAEAVLLSVRPYYINALRRKRAGGAGALEKLVANLDRPLAAILTANTIAHTVGAAGVGAQAAAVFGNQYLGLVSAVLTFLILVFSEIVPKTLGATHWKALAPAVGVAVDGLTRLLFPLVWLSEKLTKLLSGKSEGGYTFSRDEMESMADIGRREGLLDKKDYRIVANLMKLDRLEARDIMTPRPVVFSASETMTTGAFFDTHADEPFSRIPLHGDSRDEIHGYALKIDLLSARARGETDTRLGEFRRPLPVLPASLKAGEIFERLIGETSHIAMVVDEFGSMLGLVTLEDVVETLIGLEITDELDGVEDMQALARSRWRERMTAIGVDPDSLSASAE